MPINIQTLLPSNIPTQNTHRLVIITAEAQPDEFARLEITTADARAALRAYEDDPIADRPLQFALRALADLVAKRRVLGGGFRELVEEALCHLARIASDTPSAQFALIHQTLSDALALSCRVSDLLAAERDIGWHRGIGRDQ